MKIHIVKKGDTLYSLAKKYNVSLDQLIAMNPQLKEPNQLSVGMKVKVPSSSYSTGGYEVIHKHVVKEGDTLWKLSKAWGVPLNMMVAANPQLKNPNVLLVGQVVNIPKPGGEQVEDNAGENMPLETPNKKNTSPKPLAAEVEESVEVEQPKKEAAKPQATLEMKVEVIAENKHVAAPELKKEAKEEAIPIPIAPQQPLADSNMEKVTTLPVTPVSPSPLQTKKPSSPHPLSTVPTVPNSQMQTMNTNMPNVPNMNMQTTSTNMGIPMLEQQGVNASNAMNTMSNSPAENAMNSSSFNLMANAVPCPGYVMYQGWCPPSSYSMGTGPMAMNGWGGSGTSCKQGVYLGNCPPGMISVGDGHSMMNMMYAQYNPYQAPTMPTLPVMEPGMNQNFMLSNNMGMPHEQMNTTSYTEQSGKSNMIYSNIPSGIVSYEAADNYKKMKPRDDKAQALASIEPMEAGAIQSTEIQGSDVKREQTWKSTKAAKKKAKARTRITPPSKRRSVPWINR